jgi:hypothetical protein
VLLLSCTFHLVWGCGNATFATVLIGGCAAEHHTHRLLGLANSFCCIYFCDSIEESLCLFHSWLDVAACIQHCPAALLGLELALEQHSSNSVLGILCKQATASCHLPSLQGEQAATRSVQAPHFCLAKQQSTGQAAVIS